MYFPVSEIEVSPLLPVLAAFGISFFCSMGGISGAFLLLPFQMSVLHVHNPSVSGTNQFYNLLAIPSGVWRYIREKRMVWPLAATIALGTLPGVFIGALIRVAWLPDVHPFKLFAGLVLLVIGLNMVKSLTGGRGVKRGNNPQKGDFQVHVREYSLRRIAYDFEGERYQCSTPVLFAMNFFVGIIGGIYGIGGGSFTSPLLVAFFALPVHTIAGATLMGTFLTSVSGVLFYMLLAPLFPEMSVAPDWKLGLFLGLGGAAGLYLGARMQKRVKPWLIKTALTFVILGIGAKYIYEFAAGL